MIVLLAGLMLIALASPSIAAVSAVTDTSWTSWPNTVCYFARLSGPDGTTNGYKDITVHITAVDQYAIWINGNRVDTVAKNDGNWETVEEYSVAVSGSEIFVAVQVDNLGIGNGNGLMVDIEAGGDWLGTTTLKRRSQYLDEKVTLYSSIWYYFSGDPVSVIGTEWYKINATFFTDTSIAKYGLKPVMLGNMGRLDFTPNSNIETVTGYSSDLDVGSLEGGGMQLRSIEGENLAEGKSAANAALVDGNLAVGLQYAADPTGSTKEVDLGDIYQLKSLVLYTGGTDPSVFPRYSVRGFAADISLDNYRYKEVGILQEIGIKNADNGGYEHYEIEFPPDLGRYVQYRITSTRSYMPNIGEMMVFGTGYAYTGEYTSPWINLGSSTTYKNFDQVHWTGEVPEGTMITVQTRTLPYENGTASDWSEKHTEKSFLFDSPEPAVKVQYKVTLQTEDPEKTPKLKSVGFTYSKESQPLSSAKGSITPERVPMAVDTSFVYTLNYKILTGQDLKTFLIVVPSSSTVDSVVSSSAGKQLTAPDDFTASSTNDSLYITFTTPLKDSGATEDVLEIYFRSKLLTSDHTFEAGVFNSTLNDGAGPIMVWHNEDILPIVKASSIIDEMLMDVKAVPKGFSPNGDKKNDFTVLEFTLVKAETNVEIKIFDTNGTLVRKLYDGKLSPGDYRDDEASGRWDGKNSDGDLVPPGIYIYQIIAKADSGDKVKSGTVVVAY